MGGGFYVDFVDGGGVYLLVVWGYYLVEVWCGYYREGYFRFSLVLFYVG